MAEIRDEQEMKDEELLKELQSRLEAGTFIIFYLYVKKKSLKLNKHYYILLGHTVIKNIR